MQSTYDNDDRMTNEPARSEKAVLLPSVIAPNAVVRTPAERKYKDLTSE